MGDLRNIFKKILLLIWKFIKLSCFISWVVFASILGIIVLLALFLSLSCAYYKLDYNKFIRGIPFDSVAWKVIDKHEGGIADETYSRCRMYRDLVKNHLHIGMSYSEVIKLLGEPMGVDYCINPESKIIDYDVGYCTGVCFSEASSVKGYSLLLGFDRNSKLINFGHSYNYEKSYKKNNVSFLKDVIFLFSCNYENKCSRSIKLSEAKIDNCGDSIIACYDGEDCNRYIKNSNCPVVRSERCKKSEVESKWGYKVW